MHMYGMTTDEGFAFRQHLKTSGEREGYDGQAQFERYLESAAFEPSHFTVQRTGALRENDGADAIGQLLLDLFEAAQCRFGPASFDEDMSCGFATRTDKRHFAQLGFHQPFEDDGQPSVDKPNIEHRLMIGHEHITLFRLNMLGSIDTNGYEKEPKERPRPELLDLVDELRVAPMYGAHGENSGEDSQQYQQRPGNDVLVKPIER